MNHASSGKTLIACSISTVALLGLSMRNSLAVAEEFVPVNSQPNGEGPLPDGECIGTELYDLERDPQNNVNLAGLAENAELELRLSAQLRASPISD